MHALDAKQWQSPMHALQFLVGRQGKHDLGLFGGAWDPADGGHPEHDPQALISTAIRTFKSATGTDLSPCTAWCVLPDRHIFNDQASMLAAAETAL